MYPSGIRIATVDRPLLRCHLSAPPQRLDLWLFSIQKRPSCPTDEKDITIVKTLQPIPISAGIYGALPRVARIESG
jgi:hypothetical protein